MAFSAEELREALRGLDHLRYGTDDLGRAVDLIVPITHDLFSVDGAALMLIDHDLVLRNAAASDPRMEHLESLQVEYGQGPCISAFEDKTLVSCEDLLDDERFRRVLPDGGQGRAAGRTSQSDSVCDRRGRGRGRFLRRKRTPGPRRRWP